MRRLLRAVYYHLPYGRLPWRWRIAAAAWLLDLNRNEALRECVLGSGPPGRRKARPE